MKLAVFQSLSPFLKDRALLVLSLLLITMTVLYVAYTGLSIAPTELQVATRYTAFGDTQFYPSQWYYLVTFLAFAVIVTVGHIAIMVKLHSRNMRSLAVGVGALTLVLLVILFAITASVLGIAYLS